MADNTTLNTGTGGDVIASDDIAGVKHQQVKVEWGVDGTATPVSAANPMPVVQTGTHAVNATLGAETTKVIGTVNIAAAQSVTLAAGTNTNEVVGDAAHDAAAAGNPVLVGAYASAAVPTDVSGDADAVRLWALRSGALAVQPTMGGVLAVAGNGASGTGVQRVTIANDSTGILAAVTNVATIGTSVTPGTAAGNLGKAEDAAHTSGDVGVMMLGVRRDANTTLAATDGDYVPPQFDATGNLKVAIISGAGSGGTSIADGASFTRDTTSVTPIGAVVETSAPTLTNGDAAGLSMTTGGAVRVAVASGGIAGVLEDAAAAGGEEGVMILAVRRDSASSGVSADGDFACLSVDSSGNLRTTGSSGVTSYTEDAASAGAESLVLMGAVRRDTAASSSGTDGDYSTLNTDANGRLHVIAALAATQTLATVTTVSTVTNVATIGTSVTPGTSAAHLGKAEDAAHASGDTGVMSLGVRSDTAAASSGTTGDYEPFHTDSVGATWTRSTGELADDAAFTPGTSRVMPAGFQSDESATDSVDEGDIGAARMTLDRKQIVTLQPHTQGGLTIFRSLDIDETEEEVKATAGQLYFIHAMNMVATARYLKFYNATAANVTVGSTTPVLTLPIPANSTTGAGFTVSIPQGLAFGTAISVACTTGIGDADTGAPGSNDVIVNLGYM